MTAIWVFPVLFLIGGFGFQLLERLWPMRRFDTGRAVRLDVLALFWAAGLTVVYTIWFVPRLQMLPELPPVRALRAGVRAMDISPIGMALIAIVIVDFCNYWGHRLLHTKLFWPAHAFHHSPTNLYWVAGVRESPIHYFIVTLPASVAAAVFPPETLGAWLLAILVGPILNQHFIHSNVRASLGPLAWILVTPRYHFVHHMRNTEWSNTNFGFVFSFWDLWFGTHTDPALVPRDSPLGLDYPIEPIRLLLGVPPSSPHRQLAWRR